MSREGSPYDEYDFLEQIGDGSFGQVHLASHKASGTTVAIKVMKRKITHPSECINLREFKTLQLLPPHPNVVLMYESFLAPTTHELYLVMEYMNGGNLYQFIRGRREAHRIIEHHEVRHIMRQILQALAHIHEQGIFHRDMKPENLLIGKSAANGPITIKLADFGLARELKSMPPFTEYVSTRWYRAPEVLLRSQNYSYPVDLWAVGAIFAELVTQQPLFPGQSEIDQLYRICEILGSPGASKVFQRKTSLRPEKRLSPGFASRRASSASSPPSPSVLTPGIGGEWRDGVKLAHKIGFGFPQLSPKPLKDVVPTASESMLDLMRQFLYYDPSRRLPAKEALQHIFFAEELKTSNDILFEQRDWRKKPRRAEVEVVDLLTAPVSPLQVCPDWDSPETGSSSSSHSSYHHHHHPYYQPYPKKPKRKMNKVYPARTSSSSSADNEKPPFHFDSVVHYGKLNTWSHVTLPVDGWKVDKLVWQPDTVPRSRRTSRPEDQQGVSAESDEYSDNTNSNSNTNAGGGLAWLKVL
ncbi:kinase-like domain-containing protein [Syncephalastrum racemosum]|uniref:Kinase-like domain-containing protein n=1 Tax=Syncephalastrum racemosum TaxID=13706 RepID=A0A1X2HL66_SYNRA|nr:kinase-like domain-containing protein [Syncephalastrum racemosum]